MTGSTPSGGKKENIILERRFVPKGGYIIEEGDLGTCAFLIQSGLVSIYTMTDGKKTVLDHAGPGQIVGEMALIFDVPRSATVEAVEDCNLIVISRHTLKQKLEKSDPTVRALVPMLMKRVINTNNALLSKTADIDDLVKTVNHIYQNVHTALPEKDKAAFKDNVLPALDSFISAITSFQKRDEKA